MHVQRIHYWKLLLIILFLSFLVTFVIQFGDRRLNTVIGKLWKLSVSLQKYIFLFIIFSRRCGGGGHPGG